MLAVEDSYLLVEPDLLGEVGTEKLFPLLLYQGEKICGVLFLAGNDLLLFALRWWLVEMLVLHYVVVILDNPLHQLNDPALLLRLALLPYLSQ